MGQAKAVALSGVVVAVMGLAAITPAPAAVNTCRAAPDVDPATFGHAIDNPNFPLQPGTTYRYTGEEDGLPVEDVFSVTRDRKKITGVTTTVVHDQGFVDGELAEDTFDWFAQDAAGVVWYFGEDTKQIDDGVVVSTAGSWEAGVNGARAGIFMPAVVRAGDTFQQEYAAGVAEDCFLINRTRTRVTTPYVTSASSLQTLEYTRLEPGARDYKWYVAGVGEVREQPVGSDDFLELVSVTRH
jgi:hypothetical protein